MKQHISIANRTSQVAQLQKPKIDAVLSILRVHRVATLRLQRIATAAKKTVLLLPYTTVVYYTPLEFFFQARLLDNQEGANTERHVSAKLSVRCFQRRALWHPTDRDIKKKPPFTPTKKKKGAAHHHQRTQVADSYNCPAAGVPSGTCTI